MFYFFKTLLTESLTNVNDLSRVWYEYSLYSLIYVIIPFCTYYILDFKKYKDVILNGFISSGFFLGVASLFLYGKYLVQGIGRLNMIRYQTGEEVLSPLILSYSGVLTIILCFYKIIFEKENNFSRKLYLYITIILSFMMFLLGSSRGSVVVIVLILPIFLYHSPFRQKIRFTILSIIFIPILFWLIKISGSSLFNRIESTSEDKGGGRDVLWQNALNHFFDNPIIGGNIEIGRIYPHNFLIEIMMSTGIVGILLIFPLLFKGITLGNYYSKIDKSVFFVFLMLIVGLIQYSFSGGVYIAISLFIPLGIILGHIKYPSTEKKIKPYLNGHKNY